MPMRLPITYWNFYPPWIREGAAELMARIVIEQLDEAPASPSDTGCSLADTLGELDQLAYGQSVDAQATLVVGVQLQHGPWVVRGLV